jgi:hypothetical protein
MLDCAEDISCHSRSAFRKSASDAKLMSWPLIRARYPVLGLVIPALGLYGTMLPCWIGFRNGFAPSGICTLMLPSALVPVTRTVTSFAIRFPRM